MYRREELEAYIDHSKRVRRGAVWFGAVGLGLALLLSAAGAGGLPLLAVVLVALATGFCGAWITTGHIHDFEKERARLR